MTISQVVLLVLTNLVLASLGALSIFKTPMIVRWARENYEKSKIVRAYPLSSTVLKPWYPTYIRCAGIVSWLFAIALDYLFLSRNIQS